MPSYSSTSGQKDKNRIDRVNRINGPFGLIHPAYPVYPVCFRVGKSELFALQPQLDNAIEAEMALAITEVAIGAEVDDIVIGPDAERVDHAFGDDAFFVTVA